MFTEVKKLFENIKHFRHLIAEGVSDVDIRKAIENHEYIYIYYAGDETNKRGYRTIRPYVLGISKNNGNSLVRAWQDRGKSVSYSSPERRSDHDYMSDNDGRVVAGWRLFRLDKIERVYPTGKKFNDSDGNVMIPPKYREGADKAMSQILSYVSTNKEPVEPETTEPQAVQARINKWDNFTKGNKNNRKITPEDVVKLRDIASRIYKKKIGSFLVVINNNNDFDIIDVRDKHKVPENAIIGNLPNLYDTLVRKNAPDDEKFFTDEKNKLRSEIKEENIQSFPHGIKTFFK